MEFNQEKPRILHIGMAPNKNFERHVKAIADIRCQFHIIGKLHEEHKELLDLYEVDWKSEYNITDQDMRRAYIESDILLFASTLEGFGMPVIEAQTIGRPVITSNISSMPEVAGEGACLVDPFDVASIRDGILKVINNKKYRDDLIQNGYENISRFKADVVAKQYESLYDKIVSDQ